MNKELKAFKDLLKQLFPNYNVDISFDYICSLNENLSIIETGLKVLEIIKEKEMLSVFKDIYGKCFIVFNTTAVEIPQEEFDLLKEVLL